MLMKKTFVVLSLISFSLSSFAEVKEESILGFWLSESGKAVIEVYKAEKEFEGKIVWLKDLHEGKVKEKLDENNPDEKLQKRSLLGLKNLHGFTFDDGSWEGGKIYDPKSGKTYSAKMKLDGNDTLNLRGYVGISLFGRTSVWKRQQSAVPDKYSTKKN